MKATIRTAWNETPIRTYLGSGHRLTLFSVVVDAVSMVGGMLEVNADYSGRAAGCRMNSCLFAFRVPGLAHIHICK